jgi:hypothetical protein
MTSFLRSRSRAVVMFRSAIFGTNSRLATAIDYLLRFAQTADVASRQHLTARATSDIG